MSQADRRCHTAAEDRWQRLVEADLSVVSELSPDVLLRRIVGTARKLAGARWAVLAVVGPDGRSELVHLGLDAATVAALAGLPEARALLERAEPVRVRRPADQPGPVGDRATDRRVTSFLGVPIRANGSCHGLYLANRLGAEEFTAEDEQLLTAFAATAGVALGNARLHDEAQRRQEWLEAAAGVGHQLLGSGGETAALEQVADTVRRLARADAVAVVLPVLDAPDALRIAVVRGVEGGDALRQVRLSSTTSVAAEVMRLGRGSIIAAADDRLAAFAATHGLAAVHHLMVVPLQGEGRARGAVGAARTAGRPFTPFDVEMAQTFTGRAALALELADARADRLRLGLMEDRGRIARDLHDHVVQKLFAAGLSIQGAATMTPNPAVRARLASSIATLDDTIRSIRSSIFELQSSSTALTSVRGRVVATLAEITPGLGFAPVLQLSGPLDTAVAQTLAAELETVLREALTQVPGQARTGAATVRVSAEDGRLCLTVAGDGAAGGLAAAEGAGLHGLRRRAEHLGGTLELEHPAAGPVLRWSVPLQGR